MLPTQALPSEDQRVGVRHPGLMLKYSTFKNLASMAATRDDLETAMEFYLEVMPLLCSRALIHLFFTSNLLLLISYEVVINSSLSTCKYILYVNMYACVSSCELSLLGKSLLLVAALLLKMLAC